MGAFEYCASLKNIQLSSKLEHIGNWCFQDCPDLENIAIPSGVKEIGGVGHFMDVEGLKI